MLFCVSLTIYVLLQAKENPHSCGESAVLLFLLIRLSEHRLQMLLHLRELPENKRKPSTMWRMVGG